MILPCVLLACSLTAATPQAEAPPRQAPRIVLVDDEVELESALASRTPRKDVPVRLTAATLPGDSAEQVRVLIVVEIDDGQNAAGLASVAYAFSDQRGQRRAHALRRTELRRLPSGAHAFLEVAVVQIGTYRLRVAALSNNRVGTAEASLSARVQSAASLRFGDPLVGDLPGGDVAGSVAPGRRIVGDRLVVSLPLGVENELPAGLAVNVEVAKEQSGAAMLASAATILPGDGRLRIAQAVMDARVLPVGSYHARVTVSVGGTQTGRAVAQFSLDRAAAAAAGGLPAARGATGAAAAGFRLEDVLDAAVLGPFLDELAARAPERARPAIDQAKAGRFVEAAQAAASNGADDPSRPFLKGLSLLSQRQLQDASESFRDTLRVAPDYFVGAFYIGACYAAGGRDPQAINAWQTSLVGLEPYPVVFRLLSEAMSRAGQLDRVVEVLEEAASKWPDDRDLRLRLARAALEARRYDRAIDLAEAGLAKTPPDPDLLFTGMQAIFERASRGTGAPQDQSVATMRRLRDAYVVAGGPRQSLVAEWVVAVEKKLPQGPAPD